MSRNRETYMVVGGGEYCSKESKSWRAQKSISCNGVGKIERENTATFICVEYDTMIFCFYVRMFGGMCSGWRRVTLPHQDAANCKPHH
jgi:hypothetical protein